MEILREFAGLGMSIMFSVIALILIAEKIVYWCVDEKYLKNSMFYPIILPGTIIIIVSVFWAGYELAIITS